MAISTIKSLKSNVATVFQGFIALGVFAVFAQSCLDSCERETRYETLLALTHTEVSINQGNSDRIASLMPQGGMNMNRFSLELTSELLRDELTPDYLQLKLFLYLAEVGTTNRMLDRFSSLPGASERNAPREVTLSRPHVVASVRSAGVLGGELLRLLEAEMDEREINRRVRAVSGSSGERMRYEFGRHSAARQPQMTAIKESSESPR